MQRSAQRAAAADDFAFLQSDYWSDDFDLRLRTRANANYFLERSIVFGAAIGIAGAVFGHGTDVDFARADGFSPADRYGKKMRVAEWDVGDGNVCGVRAAPARRWLVQFVFRDGYALIREGGAADGAEVIELNDQAPLHRH